MADEFFEKKHIRQRTIVITILILSLFALLMAYLMIQFWPSSSMLDNSQAESEITKTETSSQDDQESESTEAETPSSQDTDEDETSDPKLVSIFNWEFKVSNEARLFVLVLLAGAFGGSIVTLQKITIDVGNKDLPPRWYGWYVMTPLISSGLGLGLYLVIRGGFFSPQADVEQTSPFSFVALAILVGLFNEQALKKLREIAGAVFSPVSIPKERDYSEQDPFTSEEESNSAQES